MTTKVDFIVGALIIVGLILSIWARIGNQTIKEVLIDLRDFIFDRGEEVEEKVGGIIEYE